MSFRRIYTTKNNILPNKTTIFLLPIFGYAKSYYTDKFIGMFLDRLDTKDPRIACIFQNSDDEDLKMHVYKMMNSHFFDDSIYDDNNKEIVLFLNVDSKFKEDCRKLIEGRYSEFSTGFKELLIKHHGTNTNKKYTDDGRPGVTVHDTINPTNEKRKLLADALLVDVGLIKEVLDKPDIEEERYYTVKELKKKLKKEEVDGIK